MVQIRRNLEGLSQRNEEGEVVSINVSFENLILRLVVFCLAECSVKHKDEDTHSLFA